MPFLIDGASLGRALSVVSLLVVATILAGIALARLFAPRGLPPAEVEGHLPKV